MDTSGQTTPCGPLLIVTADDFGRSSEINQAVMRAHHEGILTSASLMVGGEAVDEAVDMARQSPRLAVGLHVVVVDGPGALSQAQAPRLFRSGNTYPNAPTRLGIKYALQPAVRRELCRDVEAQFQRFSQTGLKLSHVDAHQHMQVHPAVFPLLLRLAREHHAAGIRLPRDDLRLALKYDRHAAGRKIGWAAMFGVLSRHWARRAGAAIRTPERCYGLYQSGQMKEDYVVSVLRSIRGRSAEIYFHPTTGARSDALGPNPIDLTSLISPVVRHAVQECKLTLSTYQDLPH